MDRVSFKLKLEALSKASETSDEKAVKSLLHEMVPEYESESGASGVASAD